MVLYFNFREMQGNAGKCRGKIKGRVREREVPGNRREKQREKNLVTEGRDRKGVEFEFLR